jgi:hypothetical protein
MARRERVRKIEPKPERRRDQSAANVPEADYLLEAARANWPHVLMMYKLFEAKKPVMLYDLQEKRVYAYPYVEFKAELSERSQLSLTEQYEDAIRDGQIVVFVRDNEQRRLRSFSMDYE